MGVNKCIADKDAVFIMLEDHLFLQEYTADTIKRGRHFVTIKLTDILMTFGAVVVALILVETEVELSSMLDNCRVERRKEHVVLVV